MYEKEFKNLVKKLVQLYNASALKFFQTNNINSMVKRDLLHQILLGVVFDRPELVSLHWENTASGCPQVIIKWPDADCCKWWE